jgi:NAD(P)-dependent dehydrogenase (short-subunit alcohol dehydrogenase family)
MTGRMNGKKALVVGAGQPQHEHMGNGRAMAMAFAREGAEVCCADREKERAVETVELIRSDGGDAHVLFGDISLADDCARLVEEAHAAMGTINVLVNNVGNSQHDADPLNVTVEAWQAIIDVNMRGTWLTSRAVIPIMEAAGGGSIINTSSVGSRARGGNLFAYSISKAGVNAITGFFAVQYAHYKIRCNAILPSWILTPHSFEGLVRSGVASTEDEIIGFGKQRVPLGFMGDAEDIGNTAVFLASEESRFVTGLELPVDGGTLAFVGQYSGSPDPAAQAKQGGNV